MVIYCIQVPGTMAQRPVTGSWCSLTRHVLRAGRGPVVIEVPIGETPAPWKFVQLPRVRPRKT